MSLHYLVKLEMLIIEDTLPLSCYRKKLQNLFHLNCGLQICQIWIQLLTKCGKYCKRKSTKKGITDLELLMIPLEFGRFAHWTSNIGNIGAKLNIEKSVASVRRYRCWKKINVKACNVVFTLITLKQHSFIVQTHI